MSKKVESTCDEGITRALKIFNIAWQINPASWAGRILEGSLLKEWLYLVIPISLFSIDILFMLGSKVLYVANEPFCYIRDISNSIVLTVLFFLSYFLSGYYPRKFSECKRDAFEQEYLKSVYTNKAKWPAAGWLILAVLLLAGISFGAGYGFYSTDGSNDKAYWIKELSDSGRIYYMKFLTLTWYQSLSVLVMLFASNFTIYRFLKNDKIIYCEEDYNQNKSIRKISDILINNFSYGIFYIGGTVIFILTDNFMYQINDIKNAFTNEFIALGVIVFVLLVVAAAYIPLQRLISFMKNKKGILLSELKGKYEKANSMEEKEIILKYRNEIASQGIFYTSNTNKLVIFSSAVIPLIGIILQILQMIITPE